MRGLKVSREYPAMYVGEHYWQDGQPLSFSDGEILCFCMAKNCKVSRVNPQVYEESRWVMD